MNQDEKKDSLTHVNPSDIMLLNEISMHCLFNLRAIAKSPLFEILAWLRSTQGEFSDFLADYKDTRLKDEPAFADLYERLVRACTPLDQLKK